MAEHRTEPHVFVVMGGTGDLMRRKLLPALYQLAQIGRTRGCCQVLAVARGARFDDRSFRAWALEALAEAGVASDGDAAAWCQASLYYQTVQEGATEDYLALAERIAAFEKDSGASNRVFYLALPPVALRTTIEKLGETGLNRSTGWTRVVVEKPFGYDLASAQELNNLLHQHFDESQIYRIDHYLGKETVKNLLIFRFANAIFESVWNRDFIDNVQITVAEDIAVGTRGGYYEQAGALRDMVQSHLTQLLSLIGMEVPVAFDADQIRFEKAKVLRSVPVIQPTDVVMGQYTGGKIGGEHVPGYRQEPEVAGDSHTETFVAMRLEIETWRWQGVPFYVRTGKRLPQRTTQIAIIFRRPPVCLFQSFGACQIHSNVLLMTIQPDEGFSLYFDVKAPGLPLTLETKPLRFHYQEVFGELPDAYHALLLDILGGDQTLFVHADEAEASWKLYSPVLQWGLPAAEYPAGEWGPPEADRLLERDGHTWFTR